MAVYRVGEKFRVTKKHLAAVHECSCGNRIVARVDMPPKSCGCETQKVFSEKDKKSIGNVILKKIGLSFKAKTGTGRNKSGSALFAVYECDCGTKIVANVWKVKTGHTRSCGCWKSKVSSERLRGNENGKKHGGCGTGTYSSWEHMKARCNDPSHIAFKHYGGRGITICDRWKCYENFKSDMGERPVGMTIDRKNNNGNYDPENCKWSTCKEQQRNKRTNRILTINSESKTVVEWAEIAGISDSIIRKRLRIGWSQQEAIFGKSNE